MIQGQALETLSINAPSKCGFQARRANRVLALLQQGAFAQEIPRVANIEGAGAPVLCDLPMLHGPHLD
jgi:hypothetical protein